MTLPRRPLVIVPGYQDSGPDHWQSVWERSHFRAIRFAPASFDEPELDDWVGSLLGAVELARGGFDEKPIIVAHSLGCLAALVCAAQFPAMDAHALFLVSPPDSNGPTIEEHMPSFVGVSDFIPRIRHRTMVVASTNDPFDPQLTAAQLALRVGGELFNVGPKGHINGASGLGEWNEGQELLLRLDRAAQ